MAEDVATSTSSKPLVGIDEATMDKQGRITLGKKMRDALGDTFSMALIDLGCICAFPDVHWQQVQADIFKRESINPGRRNYTREFFKNADIDVTCDQQGRMVVPKALRLLGKLEEKVVLVGCGDRLEMWDPIEYKEFCKYPKAYEEKKREASEADYDKMTSNPA